MKAVNIVLGIINAVCLVTAMFFLSVQTPSFGLWFYKYEFRKNDSYYRMSMEENELNYVADRIIGYLDGSNPVLDDTRVIIAGKERLFFNQRELMHMEDVLVLFEYGLFIKNAAILGFLITLAYFAAMQLFAKRKPLRLLLGLWRGFAVGVFAVLAASGLYLILNFQTVFTKFHEVFFDNDLWLLDPRTDLLINILPNQFFQDIAAFMAVMFFVLLILVIVLSTVTRKYLKKRQEQKIERNSRRNDE